MFITPLTFPSSFLPPFRKTCTFRQCPSSLTTNSTPPTHLRRPPLNMLSPINIASEVIALSVISTAIYLFLRDNGDNNPISPPIPSDASPSDRIPGLSSRDRSTSHQGVNLNAPYPPAFESVGVDSDDYLEPDSSNSSLNRRIAEELAMAAAAFSDIYAIDGVVVADAAGDIVWVDGDLVGEKQELGCVVERVAKGGSLEVLKEGVQGLFPFLKEGVREVAVLPVGTEGAVLVLASGESKFFGVVEERIATAVANRLGEFLKEPPQVGS